MLAGASGLLAMWLLPKSDISEPHAIVTPAASPAAKPPPGRFSEGDDGPVLVRYAAPKPPEPPAGELVEFCSQHVTERRCFVVFDRGTCVLVKEPSGDPVAEAVALLQSCADSSAPFIPERTQDGGMIISFKEPVFHRFSSDALTDLGPWLNQVAPALLSPRETMTAGEDWNPPYQARVGLLARRRMLEDAAAPVAVRVIRAKIPATAAN